MKNKKIWENRIISALDYILFAILLLCCSSLIKSFLAYTCVFSCDRQLITLITYGIALAIEIWLIVPVKCRIVKRVTEKMEFNRTRSYKHGKEY